MTNINKQVPPVYVVSGGRGIAGHTMVHSLIIQYPDYKGAVMVTPEVQTLEKIKEVVAKAKKDSAIIAHTMVKENLRTLLVNECKEQGVREFDFMGPLANYFEKEIGLHSEEVPGLYRRVNARYFDRIEAMEFTMTHDDGLNAERIKNAEIVLIGVSRSGKTPLSVYMSIFGWKVANIPLVKGIDPPETLFEIDPNRVFGLMIRPNHLISQRMKRLKAINNESNVEYVDNFKVAEEIRFANDVFRKGGFTVINVTNKPVESSANEIISLITERFGNNKVDVNLPE